MSPLVTEVLTVFGYWEMVFTDNVATNRLTIFKWKMWELTTDSVSQFSIEFKLLCSRAVRKS